MKTSLSDNYSPIHIMVEKTDEPGVSRFSAKCDYHEAFNLISAIADNVPVVRAAILEYVLQFAEGKVNERELERLLHDALDESENDFLAANN